MKKIASIMLVCVLCSAPAYAKKNPILQELESAAEELLQPGAIAVPATGSMEVAFSPKEGAEELVLKTINSAKSSIHVMAYSFTSAPVVSALVRAKKRGVAVSLVVDEDASTVQDKSGKSKAALGTLHSAGVAVRLIGKYAISHDKVIIVDNAHVQTGSFNYSAAAASKNSENVLVVWNNPKLASAYLQHWERNWKQGYDFRPGF